MRYWDLEDIASAIIFGLFIAGIVAIILVIAGQYNYPVESGINITVSRKEYADDKYLIFTDDEVFCIEDTMTHRRYNSSDVYNHVEEGATYIATVAGHRRPYWSMYRNILALEKVAQ